METNKKYIRKPFDVELAKKIQSGEIEGRIVTAKGIKFLDGKPVLEAQYIELSKEEPKQNFKVNEEVELYELHGKILSIKDGLVEVDIPPCGSVFVRDASILKHINRVQEKYEFKPFDKVLVHDDNIIKEWTCDVFSYMKGTLYICSAGNAWKYCIPYAGNEHLVGTTNNPE